MLKLSKVRTISGYYLREIYSLNPWQSKQMVNCSLKQEIVFISNVGEEYAIFVCVVSSNGARLLYKLSGINTWHFAMSIAQTILYSCSGEYEDKYASEKMTCCFHAALRNYYRDYRRNRMF